MEGELWRLITGHLSHLTAGHGVLNLCGLAILMIAGYGMVGLGIGVQLICLLCFALLISTAFYFSLPDLQYYGGLSGALHGLYALIAVVYGCPPIGAVANTGKSLSMPQKAAFFTPTAIGGIMLLAMAAKVVYEVFFDQNRSIDGIPVLVESHTIGALAGIGVSFVLILLILEGKVKLLR